MCAARALLEWPVIVYVYAQAASRHRPHPTGYIRANQGTSYLCVYTKILAIDRRYRYVCSLSAIYQPVL